MFKTFFKDLSLIMEKKLSSGQIQRLILACALYRNPEILIMDEPTSLMDKESKIKIFIKFFYASMSLTVIMIAHGVKNLKVALIK